MAIIGATYAHPVAGTVPPTILQAMGANTLTCTVAMADADTSALITHNWQISAADLLLLFPLIGIYQTGAGTGAVTLTAALSNSVLVTLTKGTGVGQNGTFVVILTRPFSATR